LIRRRARARSKLKVEVLRIPAFTADELRAEVVLKRDFCQSVFEQFSIGGDAGLLLGSRD
jgi:hypothetical protein